MFNKVNVPVHNGNKKTHESCVVFIYDEMISSENCINASHVSSHVIHLINYFN